MNDFITQDNFGAEALEFHKMRPKAFIMIRPEKKYANSSDKAIGETAKGRWWRYLQSKGFYRILRFFEKQLRADIPVMVCCDDPGLFDVQWAQKGRAA